jgi:hypothetical protein
MCRNHSHLIARFIGESTSQLHRVLIYELESTALAIETPGRGGATLILPTTGRLLVPSMMLEGLSAATLHQMGEHSMSLCLVPGNAMTTMQSALGLLNTSLDPSEIT